MRRRAAHLGWWCAASACAVVSKQAIWAVDSTRDARGNRLVDGDRARRAVMRWRTRRALLLLLLLLLLRLLLLRLRRLGGIRVPRMVARVARVALIAMGHGIVLGVWVVCGVWIWLFDDLLLENATSTLGVEAAISLSIANEAGAEVRRRSVVHNSPAGEAEV